MLHVDLKVILRDASDYFCIYQGMLDGLRCSNKREC